MTKEFFLWYTLLSLGVYGFFISTDLFTMFMFYETALIPMYLLIGVWGSVLCKNKTVRQAFEKGVREKFPNIEICEPAMSAQLAAALYAAKQEKGE